jgi:hypothetical protein
MLIEGGLAAIAIGISFALPRLGSNWFSSVEGVCGRLARRKGIAILAVGLSALLFRIAILPWCPMPAPFAPDDFSFLLASDTFAHGRLTNPTPAMWIHFESIHIDMQPSYMSMYFPAQGLVMAAGKVLFNNEWAGILIMSALMCAGLCWALQGWLPPGWAFLGGMLAVLHLGLFSYWVNTFHAAGSIASLGGALLLGGLPRFKRKPLFRFALAMSVGMVLMFTTRPYESMLLTIPVAFSLLRWFFSREPRPRAADLWRCTGVPLLVVFAGAGWMGYYNYRAFGSPLTLPYQVNRATYAIAPYFIWQSPRPEPTYHHTEMQRFYNVDELEGYKRGRTPMGFLNRSVMHAEVGTLYFAGFLLLPLVFMLRAVLHDRRVRFMVVCLVILCLGMLIEVFLIPHYLAPFTAAIYVVGLQAMRHVRQLRPGGQPVGVTWTRITILLIFLMCGVRLYSQKMHLTFSEWPPSTWNYVWYGPDVFGKQRLDVERTLQQLPGEQLAVVRYAATHDSLDEWVYNRADIDHSKVIWARDMDPASNQELIDYYKNRKVWLVQPDNYPNALTPYPLSEKVTEAGH